MSSQRQKNIIALNDAGTKLSARLSCLKRAEYIVNSSYPLVDGMCECDGYNIDSLVRSLINSGIAFAKPMTVIEKKLIEFHIDRIKDCIRPIDGIGNTCIAAVICRYIDVA